MSSRLGRKSALPIDEVLRMFLKQSGVGKQHNTMRVVEAWKEASGAASHTIGSYFREGVLHVTINSSMARMHLEMNRAPILLKMNALLAEDPLFLKDGLEPPYVKELKLR